MMRGFALVTNAKGAPVQKAAEVASNATLNIRFADGEVAVRAVAKSTQMDLGL